MSYLLTIYGLCIVNENSDFLYYHGAINNKTICVVVPPWTIGFDCYFAFKDGKHVPFPDDKKEIVEEFDESAYVPKIYLDYIEEYKKRD